MERFRKPKREKIDYSHEVDLHDHPVIRYGLLALGSLSFILAIAGVFLPLLPATPFFILSAACFAKSSHSFYNWIMNNPLIGPSLRDWRFRKCIPLKTKIIAVTLLLVSMGTSILFFVPVMEAKIIMTVIAILVSVWLLRIPTCSPEVK